MSAASGPRRPRRIEGADEDGVLARHEARRPEGDPGGGRDVGVGGRQAVFVSEADDPASNWRRPSLVTPSVALAPVSWTRRRPEGASGAAVGRTIPSSRMILAVDHAGLHPQGRARQEPRRPLHPVARLGDEELAGVVRPGLADRQRRQGAGIAPLARRARKASVQTTVLSSSCSDM